jgi:hypothetical protein
VPQQESQTGLSVQAPRSTNNGTLKIASVMLQIIITEPSEAESEKDKIMVITKIVLNETKWLLKVIGRSKSWHLMQMAFGGGAVSSVNSCKTYT